MRPDRESTACGCVVAVRHGAAGQAPLAVARARVPCSLDGLRCWCQVACAPGCDQALSDAEAEVSPSQRTAELVDEARQPVPTTPLLADVPLALHWRHGHRCESWGTLGRHGPTALPWAQAHCCHICIRTGLTLAHICIRIGLNAATSAPGLNAAILRKWLAPPSSAPITRACAHAHMRGRTHTRARAHARTHRRIGVRTNESRTQSARKHAPPARLQSRRH